MSLLDNDLYAFTQQQAILEYFPNSSVEYRLKSRKGPIPYSLKDSLYKSIIHLCSKKFTSDDLDYLENLGYFRTKYLQKLKKFRFELSQIYFVNGGVNGLTIHVRGSWFDTILWETPLLSLVAEHMTTGVSYEDQYNKIQEKSKRITYPLFEFGTRRRASFELQSLILDTLKDNPNFKGTSNVWFARQFDLTPIGTNAHQWYSAHQVAFGLRMANYMALRNWIEYYRDYSHLWVGLTDTFTSDLFFREYEDPYIGKYHRLCQSFRQDSGNPVDYLKYNKFPILFSDSLTVDSAKDLNNAAFEKYPHSQYGDFKYAIGTSLTNDTECPPSIVMKLYRINGRNCVKLSDCEKVSGDIATINKVEDELCQIMS